MSIEDTYEHLTKNSKAVGPGQEYDRMGHLVLVQLRPEVGAAGWALGEDGMDSPLPYVSELAGPDVRGEPSLR